VGNEDMAEYHKQEADRARHNKYAIGCDPEDILFFDVLVLMLVKRSETLFDFR